MRVSLIAACALVVLMLGAARTAPPEEWDGLQRKVVKGVDHAYVRPGADLSIYGKVLLDPAQVAFSKSWDPETPGTRFPISQEERERIRLGLAKLFDETFAKTLSEKDGYPVVHEPAPDVMRVSAALVEVYVNAPDVPTAGRTRTYTVNAGHMTLVAELRDSQTGALFARVVDTREARDNVSMTWTTSVENTGEAQEMVRRWARILRQRMDAVRQQAKPDALTSSDPEALAASLGRKP